MRLASQLDKLKAIMRDVSTMTSALNRRQWGQCLLAGAIGMSQLSGAWAKDAPMKLTLLLDDTSSMTHLPVLLAEQLGYFKAQGLVVDVLEQASTAMSMETMQGEGLFVWSAPYDQLLHVPRKEPWVAIMQTGRTPQLALGVSRKTMSHFKRLQDLHGRRMGVSALDSQARRCVDYAMVLSGDSPNELNHVAVGHASQAILALRNGQLDALCMPDPVMTLLERKGDLDIVRNFRSARESQRLFAGPMPGHSLMTTQDMVRKHPKACQALVFGVVRALKWLRTAGPSDLLSNMLDNPILLDRAIYLNAIDNMRESYSLDGMMTNEAAQTALRLRNVLEPQAKNLRRELGLTYTNEFAMQARKRFKV
jgi:NitT/TauT family transport system substrate-binding protein